MFSLSLGKKIIAVGLVVGLFAPTAAVVAASSQQILDQAFKHLEAQVPIKVQGELRLGVSAQRPSSASTLPQSMVARFQNRIVSEQPDQDEGSFSLHTDTPTSQPFVLQWKNVNDVMYIRLDSLPTEITDYLKMHDLDATVLMNQWISIEGGNGLTSSLMLPLTPSNQTKASEKKTTLADFIPGWGKRSALLVSRIEKRQKDAQGNHIMRLRVRLNPAIITLLYNKELKEIRSNTWMTAKMRNEEIKTLNKAFTEIRRFVNNLHLVAVVNETKQTLDRFEAGGTYIPSTYMCEKNGRLFGSTCKAKDMPIFKYALGVSFLKDSGAPVQPPPNPISLEDIFKKFTEQEIKLPETEAVTTTRP